MDNVADDVIARKRRKLYLKEAIRELKAQLAEKKAELEALKAEDGAGTGG